MDDKIKDGIFAGSFVIFSSVVFYLASSFNPDFDFFLKLLIDLPMQMSAMGAVLRWLLIFSAVSGLGFACLTQIKDKKFMIGAGLVASMVMVGLLGTTSLVLFTSLGILLGILISVKDASKAPANALLLASILFAFGAYGVLNAEDRSEIVFDRLALQMDDMVGQMSGSLESAARQQAVAMADMIAQVQEQTIDATTVRYNQYLTGQGLAIIPVTETDAVKEEFIDKETLEESMVSQIQTQKIDTKELLRPMLYNRLKTNLPLIGAITMFSAFGVFRSIAAPLAGLFASILALLNKKEKVKEE